MTTDAASAVNAKLTRRVATLYRVSTKKQLSPSENGGDIPTQQQACRVFIANHPDWTLVKEYTEKGVSGFKVTASNRDVIQDARRDAERGEFDILLVFKFDRLGRLDDETPLVLQWFVKQGIEMWSVVEGQQKIEGQMDKLINFLTFWQANSESVNTSIRVSESHRQMTEAGLYRGGSIPYGYRSRPSGHFNKRGKELLELEANPEEVDVIRQIYAWVVEEGYGQNRIAQRLNQRNILTGKGNTWSSSVLNAMIKNPIYKGYVAYAKRTDKEVLAKEKNPELAIVDEATWARAQDIRAQRSPANTVKDGQDCIIRSTKSSLLLIGLARCGACGHSLTTTWNKKTYHRADGTTRHSRYAKYRCSGKALRKVECSGQTVHSPLKIEAIVLGQVYAYLDRLATVDLSEQIADRKTWHVGAEERELRQLSKQADAERDKLVKYKAEVIKVISGDSKFTDQMLTELIDETKEVLRELEHRIEQIREQIVQIAAEEAQVQTLRQYVPIWRDVFAGASNEKKKMMLASIIERVRVSRDKVEIDFKIRMSQFLGAMGQGELTGPEHVAEA